MQETVLGIEVEVAGSNSPPTHVPAAPLQCNCKHALTPL